jgi:hypothetical protein
MAARCLFVYYLLDQNLAMGNTYSNTRQLAIYELRDPGARIMQAVNAIASLLAGVEATVSGRVVSISF